MIDDLKDYHHGRDFFERRIPGVFTWFLAIVLAVFAGALTWASLGEIDFVVKAPSLLRPQRNISTLKNAISGPVAVRAYVQGMAVKQGDLLWRVDTTALEVDRTNTDPAPEREALAKHRADLERQKVDAEVGAPLDRTVEELEKVNRETFCWSAKRWPGKVPAGADKLKLEPAVDNRDIAEIRAGLGVTVRFTALPPSEFGQLDAG